MQISRSATKARLLKALVAAVIASIMCCDLAFTRGRANDLAGTSKFSFKLYEQVLKNRGNKNVLISPTSIMLALAMTYNGSDGETRRAMADTLGLGSMSLDEVNRAAADLTAALSSSDPKVQLKIANSIWARKGFTPKPDFVQRTKDYYAAEVASLDFASPAAAKTINSWVSKNTEGRIEKVVDGIDDEIVMLLVNAIYFKGQWQISFEKEKTHDDVFRLAGGREKETSNDVPIR